MGINNVRGPGGIPLPSNVTNAPAAPTDPSAGNWGMPDAPGQTSFQSAPPPQKKTGFFGSLIRTGMGWVKNHVPVVGNVLNLLDAGRDLIKGTFIWLNPHKGFAEKAKAGEDLLMHTIGIFNRKVGGRYDVAEGEIGMAGSVAQKVGLPVSNNMVVGAQGIFGGLRALSPSSAGQLPAF